ncbi:MULTISPECIES: glycosyltransferase family 9 protein [Micromonospora]|uniref:Glycosyl transferase n=1 Tax=Micromonospora sicca TaxID=2202420 RepID=A0A317DMX3_9ACTN|nr:MULTISPECIES: glycosyltransferase family 9 protein [unclassified Micromonospora]MBM0228299.1 glycosyltransferase family 9 protein [Micromonospora sp. ATA51]PWR15540.1 glycosyl transferase [Micromonospora sp. 4G51]
MILVLRALGVGDLATGVPALRALRAAYPGEELALVAPCWLAPLVELVGGVDRLVEADGLGHLAWPGPPPELAVNLHGRGPQSHRMLAGVRPRRLLAFANAEAGHLDGPGWRADEHEVDRWCRLLAWYGIPADRTDLALRRPEPGRLPTGVSIVHPGAKATQRRWPPARFAAVARELTDRGHRVVVTGGPGERGIAEEVAHRAGLPADAVLAGQTDLGELAALVAHARVVISGDTGVGHLATGYATPSVLLFGPVPPAQWGPPPDRPWHQALWVGPRRPADDGGPHPALAALDVPTVLAAVERSLRPPDGPPSTPLLPAGSFRP